MPIPQLKNRSNGSFQTRRLGNYSENRFTTHHLNERPSLAGYRSSGGGRQADGGAFWRLFRRALPPLIILCLAGGLLTVGAFAWYSRDLPDPNKIIERDVAQSTKIYDRSGEHLLYEIHGDQRRTLIELTDIPQYAIDATIAIEDKNFFKHSGISVWSILRGLIVPVFKGERPQGGSTLTQQFVKNAILTNERTLPRKIKEWILSIRIEQKFTKEQILKLYFNEIPYGSTAYGIESASHIYFGKSAKDLTLAEAAVLAALPQAPSYYSPYGPNKDGLLARQQVVLDLMVEQGYITKDQATAAKSDKLEFKKRVEDITAPHFVFMVQEQLAEKYGHRLVEQGGLKIITTLDWDKQKLAQETVDELMPDIEARYKAGNTALVTIDVDNGDVLALIGSRDFFNEEIDGQVNVATTLQQPGSSFKPFVYSAAFLKGYNPKTILYDVVTQFAVSGTPYQPHNYDGKEHGPVTIRQALAGSLNIPAVKTIYLAGVKNVIELAQQFGYTSLTNPDDYGLSLVLGGADVKLIEHTNAYAALAREGVFQDYYTVLKVEDGTGKVLEEKSDPSPRRVLDKQIARQITSILSDNASRAFIFGESNYLTLGNRPVAAKSGTTNDYQDAWLMGYTPQLATGVWAGNNDNSEMDHGDGSSVAGRIWNAYMRKILAAYPILGFPADEEPTCDKPLVCGLLPPPITLKINKNTGQRATPFTPPGDIEEKTFQEVHSILHYVDKDNPLDPALPENPGQDPQYNLWEEAVKRWAEGQGLLDELPPEENDQLHSPANQPDIAWQSPQNNQTIKSSPFELRVTTSAKRGVTKVDYYLDNQYLGTATASPFNLTVTVQPQWPNGQYTLKAVAYDDVNNSRAANIAINLSVNKINPNINITWLAPTANENYTLSNFPSELKVNIDKVGDVKKVDFYYSFDNQSTWIAVVEQPQTSGLTVSWSPTKGPGVYKFYLIITDIYNKVSASEEVVVNIK